MTAQLPTTKYEGISYEQQGRGNWRILHTCPVDGTTAAIGPSFPTKTELLKELDWFYQCAFGKGEASNGLTPSQVSDICDRAETATQLEIESAYRHLTASCPDWYKTNDEQEQRDFCWLASNGPHE